MTGVGISITSVWKVDGITSIQTEGSYLIFFTSICLEQVIESTSEIEL
jgi:hypothetical protein